MTFFSTRRDYHYLNQQCEIWWVHEGPIIPPADLYYEVAYLYFPNSNRLYEYKYYIDDAQFDEGKFLIDTPLISAHRKFEFIDNVRAGVNFDGSALDFGIISNTLVGDHIIFDDWYSPGYQFVVNTGPHLLANFQSNYDPGGPTLDTVFGTTLDAIFKRNWHHVNDIPPALEGFQGVEEVESERVKWKWDPNMYIGYTATVGMLLPCWFYPDRRWNSYIMPSMKGKVVVLKSVFDQMAVPWYQEYTYVLYPVEKYIYWPNTTEPVEPFNYDAWLSECMMEYKRNHRARNLESLVVEQPSHNLTYIRFTEWLFKEKVFGSGQAGRLRTPMKYEHIKIWGSWYNDAWVKQFATLADRVETLADTLGVSIFVATVMIRGRNLIDLSSLTGGHLYGKDALYS